MNSKAFGFHATLMILVDFLILYLFIGHSDSFKDSLILFGAIAFIIGALQFTSAIIQLFRQPQNGLLLSIYFLLSLAVFIALGTLFYSTQIDNKPFYLAWILGSSFLIAHYFLYVLYRIKEDQFNNKN